MKSRSGALTWGLVGLVTMTGVAWYCLHVRRSELKVTLEFVRHAKLAATQVAIFRLKSDPGFRGELAGQGEIVEDGACYAARWYTDSSRPLVTVRGEQQIVVIEPHKGAWQLRLTFYRP